MRLDLRAARSPSRRRRRRRARLCEARCLAVAARHRRTIRALWLPPGMAGRRRPDAPRLLRAADHLSRQARTGTRRYDDKAADARARAVRLRSQASAFNGVGAGLGAALSAGDGRRLPRRRSPTPRRRSISPIATSRAPSTPSSRRSPPDAPIILAGHSQGSLPPAPPAARAGGGHAAREADRRGLCGRLAGLDHRRPARARPARLHDAPDQTGCILTLAKLRRARRSGASCATIYDASTRLRPARRARARRRCASIR